MLNRLSRQLSSWKSANGAGDEKRIDWAPILITVAPPFADEAHAFVTSLGETYETISPLPYAEHKNMSYADILATEDEELKLVVSFFSGQLSKKDFEKKMAATLSLPTVSDVVVQAAFCLFDQGKRFTEEKKGVVYIDNETPNASLSILKAMKMKSVLKNKECLVYYEDFLYIQDILHYAHKYHRPVRFARWGVELPASSFPSLIERNLISLLDQRPYLSPELLAEKYYGVNHLLSQCTMGGGGGGGRGAGGYSQRLLALKFGYEMDERGLLSKPGEGPPLPSSVEAEKGGRWRGWRDEGKLHPLPSLREEVEHKGDGERGEKGAEAGAGVGAEIEGIEKSPPLSLRPLAGEDVETSPIDLLPVQGREGALAKEKEEDLWRLSSRSFSDSFPPSSPASSPPPTGRSEEESTVVISLRSEVVRNILHGERGGFSPPASPLSPSSLQGNVWLSETKEREEEREMEEKGKEKGKGKKAGKRGRVERKEKREGKDKGREAGAGEAGGGWVSFLCCMRISEEEEDIVV